MIKTQSTDSEPTTSQTTGEVFADGSCLELIRSRDGSLKFLLLEGDIESVVDHVSRERVTYTLPLIHPSVRGELGLPAAVRDYGATHELFEEIAGFLARVAPENAVVPLTFATFASWMPEVAPVAPFLWMVLPPSYSPAALKQALRLMCRHAFIADAISPRWPNDFPMVLKPTVIAEINNPTRRLLDTFRASQEHGIYLGRGGEWLKLFCSKVIFSRERLRDRAAAGFPLEIVVDPADDYIAPLDSTRAAQVADELQGKLLAYRRANFSKVRPPTFDLGQIAGPVRAIAESLAAAIVDDDELQARLIPHLTAADTQVRADDDTMLRKTIVEALLMNCGRDEVSMADIAKDVNILIIGRGGSLILRPESIGWKASAMGLPTTDISRGRRGLRMAAARRTIDKLAAMYRLRVPDEGLSQDVEEVLRS